MRSISGSYSLVCGPFACSGLLKCAMESARTSGTTSEQARGPATRFTFELSNRAAQDLSPISWPSQSRMKLDQDFGRNVHDISFSHVRVQGVWAPLYRPRWPRDD